MKALAVFFLLFIASTHANAYYFSFKGSLKNGFGITYLNMSYSDFIDDSNSSTEPEIVALENAKLESTHDILIGYRFMKAYRLYLAYKTTSDSTKTSTGLGIKFYLPGFFFLGGKIYDIVSPSRPRWFFTSFSGEVNQTNIDTENYTAEYIENAFRFGIEMRLRLMNIHFNYSLNNVLGDYLQGIGGGLEFEF